MLGGKSSLPVVWANVSSPVKPYRDVVIINRPATVASKKATKKAATTKRPRKPVKTKLKTTTPKPTPVTVIPQSPAGNINFLLGAALALSSTPSLQKIVKKINRTNTTKPSSTALMPLIASTFPDDDHSDFGAFHHTSVWHEYLFPILVLFPVITILGNALVVLLCSIMVLQARAGRTVARDSFARTNSNGNARKLSWSRGSSFHGRTATSTATNFYLISLASADLLIGAMVMPLALYLEWTDGRWDLGKFACDLWLTVDNLATSASILSLAAIAQNRYLAIAKPVIYSNLQRKPKVFFLGIPIGFVWAVSTAVAVPILFGLNDVQDRKPHYCKLYRVEYLLYSSVVSFFIPSIAIGLQYVAVFRALGERAKRMMLRRVSVVMSRIRQGSLASTESHMTPQRTSEVTSPQPPPTTTVRFDMRSSVMTVFDTRLSHLEPPITEINSEDASASRSNSPLAMTNHLHVSNGILNDLSSNKTELFTNAPLRRLSSRLEEKTSETLRRKSEPHLCIAARVTKQRHTVATCAEEADDASGETSSSASGELAALPPPQNAGASNVAKPPPPRVLYFTPQNRRACPGSTSYSSLSSLTSFRDSMTNSYHRRSSALAAPPSSKRESNAMDDDWLLGVSVLAQEKQSIEQKNNLASALILSAATTFVPADVAHQTIRKACSLGEASELEDDEASAAKHSHHHRHHYHHNPHHHHHPHHRRVSSFTLIEPEGKSDMSRSSCETRSAHYQKGKSPMRRTSRIEIKLSRERRATVMLSVVLVLFYACWLPYFLATVSKSVCAHFDTRSPVEQSEDEQCIPDVVMHVLAWLGHANSMANPFVYAVFNPEFRAAFWHIFGHRIAYRFSSFRKSSSATTSTLRSHS